MSQNRKELNLPQNSWMPDRDTALHEIYPIPQDEGEGRSRQQQSTSSGKENTQRKRKPQRTTEVHLHSQEEVTVQEEVLGLLEEEEGEEMSQVTLVEMKDQVEIEMQTPKKKMAVA